MAVLAEIAVKILEEVVVEAVEGVLGKSVEEVLGQVVEKLVQLKKRTARSRSEERSPQGSLRPRTNLAS